MKAHPEAPSTPGWSRRNEKPKRDQNMKNRKPPGKKHENNQRTTPWSLNYQRMTLMNMNGTMV
jgi:hypothetical protein